MIPFARLVHADWSTEPRKRWAAKAHNTPRGWRVQAPRPAGIMADFVHDLLDGPQPTLAGFDFPIGLPAWYGARTGLPDFPAAIDAFGAGAWLRFYEVAERPEDISPHRPFYPRVSFKGARRADLLAGNGVAHMDVLLRACERKTEDRRAACSLFWTLGGNQVGKAAIAGWREVIRPARDGGARLWPFDGVLAELAGQNRPVLCETYPAEAYGHVGVRFRPGQGKRSQTGRQNATEMLARHCDMLGIELDAELRDSIADGFGPEKSGEDPFDAVMGLLGMIEVVEGRRAAMPAGTEAPHWEGWILGQSG